MSRPALSARPALLGGTAQLARYVFGQAGRGAIAALILLLLGAIAESISILLVIPLLTLFDKGAASQARLPLVGHLPAGFDFELVLGGLLLLILAKALFTRWRAVYTARILIDLVNGARLHLFAALGRARWEFLSRHRASDLNHLMTVEVDRLQGGAFNLLMLIQTALLLVVFFVASTLISPWMTAVAGALGLFVLAVLAPVRRMASRHGNLQLQNRRAQYATIGEFLSGLKLAKTFNAEAGYQRRLGRVLAAMRWEAIGYARVSSASTLVSQLVSALAVCAIVLFGVRVVHISLPYLVAFLLILLRTTPYFLALQNAAQELIVYLPAFRQVQELQSRAEAMAEDEDRRDAPPVVGPSQAIRIEGLGFRYAEQPHRKVLDDVSFTIPAGQITALVGPSGGGKSTLADLLLGLQRPSCGAILVDGVELNDGNRRGWRECTAYVSQEVFLMHDSIGANLALARPSASEAELWRALELAAAGDFVRRLPDGLQAVVGDRGARLSGGERQRIALARALLRNPRLLVLDEATSALDWENQQAIAEAIAGLRGKLTIVTIAHRPSMIAFADHVVAIDRGRIAEEGAYHDLALRSDGALARMLAGENLASNVTLLRKRASQGAGD